MSFGHVIQVEEQLPVPRCCICVLKQQMFNLIRSDGTFLAEDIPKQEHFWESPSQQFRQVLEFIHWLCLSDGLQRDVAIFIIRCSMSQSRFICLCMVQVNILRGQHLCLGHSKCISSASEMSSPLIHLIIAMRCVNFWLISDKCGCHCHVNTFTGRLIQLFIESHCFMRSKNFGSDLGNIIPSQVICFDCGFVSHINCLADDAIMNFLCNLFEVREWRQIRIILMQGVATLQHSQPLKNDMGSHTEVCHESCLLPHSVD